MRRRAFLTALATAALSTSAAGEFESVHAARTAPETDSIPALEASSTASLLDENDEELTDDGVVAVWAEETATNDDSDGDGYGVVYGDSTSIPLVAVDGNVVGVGSMLVTDGRNWQRGNEEFVLNVWDAHLGGSGTVLWDEGHGQYYDLGEFGAFEAYAEENGYAVEATTSIADDLRCADAAVITSPSEAFTKPELAALRRFVSRGGALFLHDQSDHGNYDETANLNDVPDALGLAFRFNDDEVLDEVRNGGDDYEPLTDEFNADFDYFGDREGLGLDPDETYAVSVLDVTDGDTARVEFDDGTEESIRILGIDTPEKSQYSRYERTEEWEGIEDADYLERWADEATVFGREKLLDETVDLAFDGNEPVRDAYDRVLGYLYYDDGGGARDALYNYDAVAEGYARVYGSGFAKHDEFWQAEAAARADGLRVWTESDPKNSSEIRDNPVEELFFPVTASVRTESGAVDDDRVPVSAEETATQDLDGGIEYESIPLVAVDEQAGVAVVGGPIVDERYEEAEGFGVDTSTYGNFVFLTNLVDFLSTDDGDVLIDGGHDQFGADFALSNEDAAYYQRYLEGQGGIGFEQVNDLADADLSRGRALVVSTPAEAFADAEIDAVRDFAAAGGAVVLLGSGRPTPEARANLNDLAAGIGTDLRLNADRVVDDENRVGSDSELPDTTVFDDSFPLFDAYSTTEYAVSVPQINEDGDSLNEEWIDIRNDGDEALDATGWRVRDEAGYTYEFPDGFTLAAGATVRLHTGDGEDTDTDLYWGSGTYVWNDGGDTVYIYDAGDNLAAKRPYPTDDHDCDADVCVAEINEKSDTLNGEWVDFENTTESGADLTGWTVEDEASYTYEFPDGFALAAGATVRLHTGDGEDTDTDLYWGSGTYIWNDGGDTVFLYEDDGSLHASRSY